MKKYIRSGRDRAAHDTASKVNQVAKEILDAGLEENEEWDYIIDQIKDVSELQQLANHPSYEVRYAVTLSPIVTPSILKKLADDEHEYVRLGVAKATDDITLLEKLSHDEDPDVSEVAQTLYEDMQDDE